MKNEWKEVCLEDLIDIKHGYGFKGEFFVEEPNQNILVTPGNFAIGGGFKADKLKYYDGPIKEDFILNSGDVIVTMTDLSKQADTLGYSAKVPDDGKTYLHNQRIGLVSLKSDDTSLDFIYWLLRTEGYQKYIAASSTGATVKHTSPDKIYSAKLSIPSNKRIQQRIADILSAYDNLIENNLQRINLLDEQIQLIFKKYLGRGLNNDWIELPLGNLIGFHIGGGWGKDFLNEDYPVSAYVIRGTDIDGIERGGIHNVPHRWHKTNNLKSRAIKHGDIIFEVSGGSSTEGVAKTLLVTDTLLSIFDDSVMCASFCKLMRPESTNYSYYLSCLLTYLREIRHTEIYEKRSASNIVNYNWDAFLRLQKVRVPDEGDLTEFNDIIEPLVTAKHNLSSQIIKLKEARDILLPRLMTGMIEV